MCAGGGSFASSIELIYLKLIAEVIIIIIVAMVVVVVAVATTATATSTTATKPTAHALRGPGTRRQLLSAWCRHVLGTSAAVLRGHFELHFLAHRQRAESAGLRLEGREVHKVLLLIRVILNETESTAVHPRHHLTRVAQEGSRGKSKATREQGSTKHDE